MPGPGNYTIIIQSKICNQQSSIIKRPL